MHPTSGEIRAYLDQELPAEGRQGIAAHMAACPACQAKAQALQEQAQRVVDRMATLEMKHSHPLPIPQARARLSTRLSQTERKEQTLMSKFTRIPRPAWVGLTIVLVLAIALAFPPVRAIANSFLQLFRVEQVRVLPVDWNKLPGNLDSSAALENVFSKSVEVQERGEPQEVANAAEASAVAGFAVHLPTAVDTQPKVIYQPGGTLTFTVDLALMRAVLEEIGRPDIELPDSIDGSKVRVDIAGSVVAAYGECQQSESLDPDQAREFTGPGCTTFVQMPSPVISAPPEMDLLKLGEAYLQMLGMDKEEAASFAENVDWTSTFVIPVPRNSADYREVTVNGVPATLINYYRGEPVYMLMWIENDILYALGGPGRGENALEVANSLK
jgi:hypothetical protein